MLQTGSLQIPDHNGIEAGRNGSHGNGPESRLQELGEITERHLLLSQKIRHLL